MTLYSFALKIEVPLERSETGCQRKIEAAATIEAKLVSCIIQ